MQVKPIEYVNNINEVEIRKTQNFRHFCMELSLDVFLPG